MRTESSQRARDLPTYNYDYRKLGILVAWLTVLRCVALDFAVLGDSFSQRELGLPILDDVVYLWYENIEEKKGVGVLLDIV